MPAQTTRPDRQSPQRRTSRSASWSACPSRRPKSACASWKSVSSQSMFSALPMRRTWLTNVASPNGSAMRTSSTTLPGEPSIERSTWARRAYKAMQTWKSRSHVGKPRPRTQVLGRRRQECLQTIHRPQRRRSMKSAEAAAAAAAARATREHPAQHAKGVTKRTGASSERV